METTLSNFQTPFDPDYIEQPMILQLMKIVDSIGNPKPLHYVRTDDGDEVYVGHKAASKLVELFRNSDNNSKFDSVWNPEKGASMHHMKREFLSNIQYTKGLREALAKVDSMYK